MHDRLKVCCQITPSVLFIYISFQLFFIINAVHNICCDDTWDYHTFLVCRRAVPHVIVIIYCKWLLYATPCFGLCQREIHIILLNNHNEGYPWLMIFDSKYANGFISLFASQKCRLMNPKWPPFINCAIARLNTKTAPKSKHNYITLW